jgi:hypothetical protein
MVRTARIASNEKIEAANHQQRSSALPSLAVNPAHRVQKVLYVAAGNAVE